MTTRSADEWEMSRSCQRATFSRPTSEFARTTRARPQIRSATTGFRLCGIADEPFWPRPNGSCTSPTSVRARCRISSANASSEDATTASAARSSAWRSRWRICVEVGAGSRPSRSHAMPLELGIGRGVRADGARELARRASPRAPARRARGRARARTPSRRASARRSSARHGRRACGRSAASRGAPAARAVTTAKARSRPARISAPASRTCSESAVSTTSEDVRP